MNLSEGPRITDNAFYRLQRSLGLFAFSTCALEMWSPTEDKQSKSLNDCEQSRKATSCCLQASLLLIYFPIVLVLFFNNSTTLLTHIHHMVLLDSQVSVCCTCACLASLFLTIICAIIWMVSFLREFWIYHYWSWFWFQHSTSPGILFSSILPHSDPLKASPNLLQEPPNWFLCHHLSQLWSSICTVIMSCFRHYSSLIRQLPLEKKWSLNPLDLYSISCTICSQPSPPPTSDPMWPRYQPHKLLQFSTTLSELSWFYLFPKMPPFPALPTTSSFKISLI